MHGAGLDLDSSARVQGSLRSALTGRPWTRPRSAVKPAPRFSPLHRMTPPMTRRCILIRMELLRHCSGLVRAVAEGVAFACDRAAFPLLSRCVFRITSLNDALSPCNRGLMGIERFSRRKPVVVATTQGTVLHTQGWVASLSHQDCVPAPYLGVSSRA